MGIKKVIKSFDMFGHPITLNFNRQGDNFFTTPGGIVSLLTNLILGFYIYIIFRKMYERKGDAIGSTRDLTIFEEIGDISMQEAEIMPIIMLKSSQTYGNLNLAEVGLMNYMHFSVLLN
jgi:hypothetical protein